MAKTRVVRDASELLDAVGSDATNIEVQGTIAGMPMITLRPGVTLRGGVLEFGAKGVWLTSQNTLDGVTVHTAEDEVAILNDTSVEELGHADAARRDYSRTGAPTRGGRGALRRRGRRPAVRRARRRPRPRRPPTRRGGRKGLPPRPRFAPSSASDERRDSALRAAPGIASALCGSARSSSKDLSRRVEAAHNPRLRDGASRERAPRSDGCARR